MPSGHGHSHSHGNNKQKTADGWSYFKFFVNIVRTAGTEAVFLGGIADIMFGEEQQTGLPTMKSFLITLPVALAIAFGDAVCHLIIDTEHQDQPAEEKSTAPLIGSNDDEADDHLEEESKSINNSCIKKTALGLHTTDEFVDCAADLSNIYSLLSILLGHPITYYENMTIKSLSTLVAAVATYTDLRTTTGQLTQSGFFGASHQKKKGIQGQKNYHSCDDDHDLERGQHHHGHSPSQ